MLLSQGVGAWHDVLIELGRTVERSRVPIVGATIDPATTVVVVDPEIDEFDRGYAQALLGHAEGGGRLVLVGVRNVGRLFDVTLDLTSTDESRAGLIAVSPLTAGVETVSVGEGTRYLGNDLEVLVSDDVGAVVVRWAHRRGEVIAVSDPWMFTNGWINGADNAVLAVRLTGAGPVLFDEYVHGFGVDTGLSGLGAIIVTVVAVGTVAALVGMWAVGKRLGPAEQRARALPPSRAEYLDAMARSLTATKDRSTFSVLRVRALRHVHRIGSRYVGLTPEEQHMKAAAQLGLTAEEVTAISGRMDTRDDVAAVAAAAARIEQRARGNAKWTS